MKDAINWFEIPVKNYERAKKFYTTVLGVEITEAPMPESKYGVFAYEMSNGVGGAIIESKDSEPSDKGSLVYLNGGDDIDIPVSKVEKAGGKIVFPKMDIGENGFIAHFIDTEGNKIGLHSMN